MQKSLLFAVVLLCSSFSPAQETAGSLIQKGEQAYNEERYKTALVAFLQGVSIAEKQNNEAELLKACNYLSVIYSLSGEYASALHYATKSLTIYKKEYDYRNMALKSKEVAILHMRQKNYSQSLEFYKQAYTYAGQSGESLMAADCLVGCGRVLQKQNDYEGALGYYLQAIGTYDTYNQLAKKGLVLSYTGSLYNSMGNYEKSIETYKEALGYFDSLKDLKSVALTLNDLGRAFAQTGDYTESLELHKQAYIDAAAIKFEKAVADACYGLAEAYEHLGHHPDALRYRKLYEQKADSITIRKKQRDEARLHLKQQALEAQKEIEQITLQNTSKPETLQAYNFYGLIACGASFGVLLLTVIYYKKERRKLEKKHKKQIHRLSRVKDGNVYQSMPKKITLPAADINDRQQVTTTHLNGTMLKMAEEGETPERLAEILRNFISGYLGGSTIELLFSVADDMSCTLVSKEVVKALRAVINETMGSILLQKKATRVCVNIYNVENGLEISIKDDGQGHKSMFFNGNFLRAMSKLKIAEGDITIEPVPGWGTTIKIFLPFLNAEKAC